MEGHKVSNFQASWHFLGFVCIDHVSSLNQITFREHSVNKFTLKVWQWVNCLDLFDVFTSSVRSVPIWSESAESYMNPGDLIQITALSQILICQCSIDCYRQQSCLLSSCLLCQIANACNRRFDGRVLQSAGIYYRVMLKLVSQKKFPLQQTIINLAFTRLKASYQNSKCSWGLKCKWTEGNCFCGAVEGWSLGCLASAVDELKSLMEWILR